MKQCSHDYRMHLVNTSKHSHNRYRKIFANGIRGGSSQTQGVLEEAKEAVDNSKDDCELLELPRSTATYSHINGTIKHHIFCMARTAGHGNHSAAVE